MTDEPSVCLLVPTFNEGIEIADHLTYHGTRFDWDEVVVVDGNSTDGTVGAIREVQAPLELVSTNEPGRGRQLKKGADHTDSEWIVMLHADTYLPDEFNVNEILDHPCRWGWFNCQLDDRALIYRVISRAINLRSALFSSPTGDQVIWVHRDLLRQVGGVPTVPIMEDVMLVQKLRREEPGGRLTGPVRTSARKWKQEGVLNVILSMWWFRLVFWLGASPEWIYQQYYDVSTGPGRT